MADVIDECPPLAKLFEGGFLERRFQQVFQVKLRTRLHPVYDGVYLSRWADTLEV